MLPNHLTWQFPESMLKARLGSYIQNAIVAWQMQLVSTILVIMIWNTLKTIIARSPQQSVLRLPWLRLLLLRQLKSHLRPLRDPVDPWPQLRIPIRFSVGLQILLSATLFCLVKKFTRLNLRACGVHWLRHTFSMSATVLSFSRGW